MLPEHKEEIRGGQAQKTREGAHMVYQRLKGSWRIIEK
jgi:hypothetical protein